MERYPGGVKRWGLQSDGGDIPEWLFAIYATSIKLILPEGPSGANDESPP
jgi:hypothetical protein